MDRKSKGKAVLTESDTGFDYSPVGLSILVVDHDQKSLQEVVTNLRKCKHQYKVTECNQVEEALTLLRMDFSGFDIIITEQRLLGISEFELVRIGRERGLPVVVTSEDDGVDTIQRSLDYGACAYMEKPIPMRDLNMVWTHVYSSRKNKLAQVQKPANDMSRAKKCRMSWKMDIQEKFVESVQEMGIDKATPKKVLERMKTKGVRNVSRDQVSSHLQKHRLKLQKQAPPLHMQEYKDKDGTSSGHVESRYEMEHPPMTLLNGFLNTPDPNQLDISSQQQRAPAAIKNTHGFPNLPLPVEANFCTIEGAYSFYWNESWPVGIFEHFTWEDIAHDHSENLFFDDDTGSQPLDYLKPKSESGEVIPNSKENASLLNTLRRRRRQRRQGMKIKSKEERSSHVKFNKATVVLVLAS
ncbi:two-component response regulator ORR26-like [Quercus suber]|uniref:two-component response regulator ORR26-like n=1 Tax=Quercus suber TaxID=58331 RepID=UPI0032DFFCE2